MRVSDWVKVVTGLLMALWHAAPALGQAVVTGTVRDSLTGLPFSDALVELVPTGTPWLAGFSARTDAAGRFTIPDVASGTYHFGFQHPRLDSLGMDPLVRTLEVRAARRRLTADLALPTARTFARTLCRARNDDSGVLLGRVIDARDGRPVTQGSVQVRWGELSVGNDGLRNDEAQRTARIRNDGRFIVCNVPTDGPIEVQAVAGSLPNPSRVQPRVSSGRIELQFDYDTPLRHRDLYVAPEERDVEATRATVDSTSGLPRAPRRGVARLGGRVVGDGGRPVAGARVVVREATAEATTDSTGTFQLSGLPLGTHTVEMLALGMMPMRTAADLRADTDASVTFRAARRVQALDAITVRSRADDPAGFWRRRASGAGYYVDADQMRKWGPPSLGNALAMAPMLRRNLTGRGGCTPTIFVDAMRVEIGPVDEILSGLEIGGIEVYPNPADVPPQFGSPGSRPGAAALSGGCATIVVWTKAYVN